MSIYFSIPQAWDIGWRINNADPFWLRALIPSGVWLKSPSAPGSKLYYTALSLAFSFWMGIRGPTWRQIGYQSQGWYKDRLWKSIGRRSCIGLAYSFLLHSEALHGCMPQQEVSTQSWSVSTEDTQRGIRHPDYSALCLHNLNLRTKVRKCSLIFTTWYLSINERSSVSFNLKIFLQVYVLNISSNKRKTLIS